MRFWLHFNKLTLNVNLRVIDGIKIRCIGTLPLDWECNQLLKFASSIDTTTGEILAKNKVAFYRGLSFHLIPSTVANNTHCIIKGSLATYYNQGTNNAFDYDVAMLQETILELEKLFKINPITAEIQAFEFGANISPIQPTKQIINGLRAYQGDNFTGLKIDFSVGESSSPTRRFLTASSGSLFVKLSGRPGATLSRSINFWVPAAFENMTDFLNWINVYRGVFLKYW